MLKHQFAVEIETGDGVIVQLGIGYAAPVNNRLPGARLAANTERSGAALFPVLALQFDG